MRERLKTLYRERFGEEPEAMVALAGDGSARTYLRLVGTDGRTAVGAFGPDPEENRAFLGFSRAFREIDLPVPEIYAADEAAGVWLEEDLGDVTLFDALAEGRQARGGRFPEVLEPVYRRVLDWLPRFQLDGHAVVDYDLAYPRAAFDAQSIRWDCNYFKYHFLKLARIPFHEARLESDFRRLADFLLEAPADSFLYRDFQSRNVMLRDGEPWFLDYQGGRRGALHYDVASLLYDGKADLPDPLRERLLVHYLDRLAERRAVDRAGFEARFRGFVVVRIMQALGAYGYRGFFERKPRFLHSVPYAARNLAGLLRTGLPLSLPELEETFARIAAEWSDVPGEHDAPGVLTVFVQSFSYRRGYPEDASGHGGGFVFDCRALPNPGRLERFRTATGRDPGVVGFLESSPEAGRFWENACALADAQVEEYLRRGFSHLSIAFGCTGGQHRSVWLAERLGRHLEEAHPEIRVRVQHREEPSWPRPEGVVGRA